MGAYQVEWGQKEQTTSKNKKETTMCMSGCISSVGEGNKNNDKREWAHIKCEWRQKEQTTSKNKKETTMCMSGCISSVGEGYKNNRQAWMGAYQVWVGAIRQTISII